jgi:hypothetical protein
MLGAIGPEGEGVGGGELEGARGGGGVGRVKRNTR